MYNPCDVPVLENTSTTRRMTGKQALTLNKSKPVFPTMNLSLRFVNDLPSSPAFPVFATVNSTDENRITKTQIKFHSVNICII